MTFNLVLNLIPLDPEWEAKKLAAEAKWHECKNSECRFVGTHWHHDDTPAKAYLGPNFNWEQRSEDDHWSQWKTWKDVRAERVYESSSSAEEEEPIGLLKHWVGTGGFQSRQAKQRNAVKLKVLNRRLRQDPYNQRIEAFAKSAKKLMK